MDPSDNRQLELVGQQLNSCTTNTTTGPSNSNPPRAYQMGEYYKQRREFKLQQVKAEEERLRKHTARPMPNFGEVRSKFPAPKNAPKAPVSPKTPEVLRRGLATKEKQKQKEHEQLAERSAKVFKPILPLHPEPFKLRMTERLKERKEFDSNYQQKLIKKKEQEELRKQQEDEQSRQLLRQQTIFRAKPNPFKKN